MLQNNKEDELCAKLKTFAVRLVLTAHPTQFYPGSVLGIINDLSKALAINNAAQIKDGILSSAVPTASLAGKCVTGGRLNVSGF